MKILAIILFSLVRPNEIREFTHINGVNYVKTEIIIMHSMGIIQIPNEENIYQKWEFKRIDRNTYEISNGESNGVLYITRTSAVMWVDNQNTFFENKRLKVILQGHRQEQ
jgi:hypothetical protein